MRNTVYLFGAVMALVLAMSACNKTVDPGKSDKSRTSRKTSYVEKKGGTETWLSIQRNERGTLLSWDSKEGVYYTIQYQKKYDRNRIWHEVPNARWLPGTGKKMSIMVRLPDHMSMRYRTQSLTEAMIDKIKRSGQRPPGS